MTNSSDDKDVKGSFATERRVVITATKRVFRGIPDGAAAARIAGFLRDSGYSDVEVTVMSESSDREDAERPVGTHRRPGRAPPR
jgi:hypothetical protein